MYEVMLHLLSFVFNSCHFHGICRSVRAFSLLGILLQALIRHHSFRKLSTKVRRTTTTNNTTIVLLLGLVGLI